MKNTELKTAQERRAARRRRRETSRASGTWVSEMEAMYNRLRTETEYCSAEADIKRDGWFYNYG